MNEHLINILRVERLYYMLKKDPLGDGKRLWFDLAEMDNDHINSVLPGEIKDYKKGFDPETRYEIHSRIAQIEFEANHLTQARREWMQVRELGEQEGRDEWVAAALFSLANCERDAESALKAYLEAKEFCEKKAKRYLAGVYYNIGFTYRRMQDIDKAIEWYRLAQDEFQKNPWDEALGAKIANDLGYAYSHIGAWAECRENVREGRDVRQRLHAQLEQEVARIEEELKGATDIDVIGKLRDRLIRQKAKLSKAAFQLGLSFSTLGEIYRYDNDFEGSLRNYQRALRRFEESKNYRWQAKTLFSSAETRRRIARNQFKGVDESSYRESMQKAQEEIQESLNLCEKYRIKIERDTANRRMGRLMHDLALDELEQGDKPVAREYLEQARSYFVEGLKYARETNDVLEELGNLAELAFIVDDFMAVAETISDEYRASQTEFKQTLDAHRKDKFRIYQFPVFENLYKLEKAATDFQRGDYAKALQGYREAFVGLAADPGYGRTRYKQHFAHLKGQIEKLSPEVAKVWCEALIRVWEKTYVNGKERTLAQEIRRPDLVVWCRQQLNKIETQRA